MKSGQENSGAFSRRVGLETMGPGDLKLPFEADEIERKAIAEALDLLDLKAFGGAARLTAISGGGACLEADFAADVVQSCVVTLEPVPSHIEHAFSRVYLPASAVPAEDLEVEIDPAVEDPPEALEGDELDVGAAVLEQLVLLLNPYPRQPNVSLADFGLAGENGENSIENSDLREGGKASPFAILKKLKDEA